MCTWVCVMCRRTRHRGSPGVHGSWHWASVRSAFKRNRAVWWDHTHTHAHTHTSHTPYGDFLFLFIQEWVFALLFSHFSPTVGQFKKCAALTELVSWRVKKFGLLLMQCDYFSTELFNCLHHINRHILCEYKTILKYKKESQIKAVDELKCYYT